MNAKDPQPPMADGPDNTRTAGRNLSLLVCFLVIVLDGFNTTSISFVVPTLTHAWGLAPALFTSVFVATNIGAALGFMSTGPLSERFGLRSIGLASVVLFGASTLPDFRNKGVQTALLRTRLKRAGEEGCDLAMSLAQPGSASQRNIVRQGFHVLYTRVKFGRAVPGSQSEQR